MRTQDVKVGPGYSYLYKGIYTVWVDKRIKGGILSKRNMQSGELFTGNHRATKMFLLNTGDQVYAKYLTLIDSINNHK